jgi:hypothetical protein
MANLKPHRGNILAGELVGCVRNQKARLSDSTISNNNALDGLHDDCLKNKGGAEQVIQEDGFKQQNCRKDRNNTYKKSKTIDIVKRLNSKRVDQKI